MAFAATITVLFEKLFSTDLIELARSEGIYSHLKTWNKILLPIRAVLDDAGQKQMQNRAVHKWLHDLQDVVYDIDDALDDMAIEAMQRLLNGESYANATTNKVLKIIPILRTLFAPRKYGRKMSSNLGKITTKLRELNEIKDVLALNTRLTVERSNRMSRGYETTSLIDSHQVLGREGDKLAIRRMLLGNEPCNQTFSIVSIVGMGGIGKTTLAQVLYNDSQVKDHFDMRAWVCVSDAFDIFRISKHIFESLSGRHVDFGVLDSLQAALREILSKKRFLLVLDDVWNKSHDHWEVLQRPFFAGAPGSKILVTTRDITVASMMDTLQSYKLPVLPNDIALSLFAKHALGEENFDKHPTLELYGKHIVDKCQGLPLALKSLGGMLRTKTVNDWEEVLNSEIWDIPDNYILPALTLSYYDLPDHLKCLFAYCCLFPLGYEFDKDELVLLWMAE